MWIVLLFTLNVFAAPPVIYGEDSRRDIYEEKNPKYLELSRAVAAKVATIMMKKTGTEVQFRGQTLKDRGICSHQRFADQQTASLCSGFLISSKLLMTAGHCVRTINDCKNFRWVFDFEKKKPEESNISVPSTSVYSCSKVIARKDDGQEDYAVIELDREVTDRKPLKLKESGSIMVGTPLLVIGHPNGLPKKIADGAEVRSIDNFWFTANLDTFSGNSGSAVINAETHLVEGILVRGEVDYLEDPVQGCKLIKRCKDDECRGEDVNFLPVNY